MRYSAAIAVTNGPYSLLPFRLGFEAIKHARAYGRAFVQGQGSPEMPTSRCGQCGFDSAPDHAFCGRCGAALPASLGAEGGTAEKSTPSSRLGHQQTASADEPGSASPSLRTRREPLSRPSRRLVVIACLVVLIVAATAIVRILGGGGSHPVAYSPLGPVLTATPGNSTGGGTPVPPPTPTHSSELSALHTAWIWHAVPARREPLAGVSCATTPECVAVGRNGTLLVSSDDGATWTRRVNPAVEAFSAGQDIYSVSCAAPALCVVVGASGDEGSVAVSADGGSTWRQPTSSFDSVLRGVSCLSTKYCMAVGENGRVNTTENGGITWRQVNTDASSSLNAVSCSGTGICVVVGDSGGLLVTGDGGATWGTRPNTTPALYGVDCKSACVAVGAGGTVLMSVDGGLTWSARDSGTSEDLRGVSCASKSFCMAVGGEGTLISSSDGGATWASHASGLSHWLPNAISCTGQSFCVAVGGDGTIATTRDGGSTWIARADPASDTGYDLNSVSCPKIDLCVAVGARGSILQSTDVGATWINRTSGTGDQLVSVTCLGGGSCVALGLGDSWRKGTSVLTSSDGGRTWIVRPSVPPTGDRGALLDRVSCATVDVCVAVGDHGVIEESADGGATWTQRPSPVSDNAILDSVSCPNVNRCVVVGDAVLTSVDRGATWTQQISPVRGPNQSLTSVTCSNLVTCVAVGPSGITLTSADGGVSWIRHSNPLISNDDLASVSCPTPTACVAVYSRGILISMDGGASWNQEHPGSLPSDVSCAAANACVIVGSDGTILTNAYGVSKWTRRDLGANAILHGISCPTARRCVAVGNGGHGGEVFTSTDGGVSWTGRGVPSAIELYAVDCASDSACVTAGNGSKGGIILSSSDGGMTWTERLGMRDQSGFGAWGAASVSCRSEGLCVAGGQPGVIFVSRDSGVHWTRQTVDRNTVLNGVVCASARACVAVGGMADSPGFPDALPAYGVILTSDDGGVRWTQRWLDTGLMTNPVGVSCSSERVCVAVGDRSILRTADAGATWSIQATSAWGLQAVSCPDTRICFAVGAWGGGSGDGAFVLDSEDGGVSWIAEPLNVAGLEPRAVSCASADECVAVGVTLASGAQSRFTLTHSSVTN